MESPHSILLHITVRICIFFNGIYTNFDCTKCLIFDIVCENAASACFGNKHIDGVMIAALSEPLYKGGSACGQHFEVTCVGGIGGSPNPCRGKGKVVVKAVDLCPKGCRGTIDLSQEAFASIADPDAGVIKIAFRR